MKNSSLSTKLIVLALTLTVLAYFAVQGYRSLAGGYTTVPVYTYRTEDSVSVRGFVVRAETVLTGSGALLEPTRSEGERVSRGGTVANAYESAEALERVRRLDELNGRLEQLESAREASGDADSALRLEQELAGGIVALRAAMSVNGGISAESACETLKTAVLKRAYALKGEGELDRSIAALREQIERESSAEEGRVRVSAPFAGTYSAVTDGYENVLRPENLELLMPGELDRLTPEAVPDNAAGRLIEGETWYFAAAVDEKTAARAAEAGTVTLRFARGIERELTMRVHSVSEAENGRAVLVLSCGKYLAEITLLREQSADVIFVFYEGLRVPNSALRISAEGVTGVYCRVGRTAYFKPVEVIYRGEDYCLVTAGEIDSTRESTIRLYTLRAGDELILTAEELYDGKVLD